MKTKTLIETILKIFFGIIVFYFLYNVIQKYDINITEIKVQNWKYLIIALFLMPINWGLEAAKWKYLVSKFNEIKFQESFNIVLRGLTLGFFTPARSGDILIRHLSLNNKEHSLGAIFINRFSQSIPTFVFGLFGFALLFNFTSYSNQILAFALIILLCLLFMVFIMQSKKLKKYTEVFTLFTIIELFKLLFLSTLRYMIFTFQFVLILKSVGVDMILCQMLNGVFSVFFLKSIIPFVNMFGEIGLRESASIFVFVKLNQDPSYVLISSLLLWFINIFIPALAGLYLTFKVRIVK